MSWKNTRQSGRAPFSAPCYPQSPAYPVIPNCRNRYAAAHSGAIPAGQAQRPVPALNPLDQLWRDQYPPGRPAPQRPFLWTHYELDPRYAGYPGSLPAQTNVLNHNFENVKHSYNNCVPPTPHLLAPPQSAGPAPRLNVSIPPKPSSLRHEIPAPETRSAAPCTSEQAQDPAGFNIYYQTLTQMAMGQVGEGYDKLGTKASERLANINGWSYNASVADSTTEDLLRQHRGYPEEPTVAAYSAAMTTSDASTSTSGLVTPCLPMADWLAASAPNVPSHGSSEAVRPIAPLPRRGVSRASRPFARSYTTNSTPTLTPSASTPTPPTNGRPNVLQSQYPNFTFPQPAFAQPSSENVYLSSSVESLAPPPGLPHTVTVMGEINRMAAQSRRRRRQEEPEQAPGTQDLLPPQAPQRRRLNQAQADQMPSYMSLHPEDIEVPVGPWVAQSQGLDETNGPSDCVQQ